MRLMVVVHAGAAGHRGQAVTIKVLSDGYVWPGMEDMVRQFVRACLLCVKTRGGKCSPTPRERREKFRSLLWASLF